MLRTWTAQDTQSHAMQWKIRLRPKSVASPWITQSRRTRGRGSSSNQSQQQHQQQRRRQQRQEQELDQLQDHGQPLTHDEQQQQHYFHAGATVISMTDALQLDHQTADEHEGSDIATLHRVSWVDPRHRREHPTQGEHEDDNNQRPPSFIRHTSREEPSSPPASPSPIATLYETFRARTQRVRRTTMDSISPSTTATMTATNTPNTSPVTSSIPVPAARGEPPVLTYTIGVGIGAGTSIWSIIKESMSNSLCCGFWFVEPKVWLIEISLRECQLDEYAVMVPSPVYCDYRLPGYDDVMAGTVLGGGEGGSSSVATAASSSRTGLNRYNGLPPAYVSESDSEGEDDHEDDDEDDDDDHEDDDLENGGIGIQIQGSAGCRLTHPSPAHLPDIGATPASSSAPAGSNSSNLTTHSSQPQMEMIQRSGDMTSVIVLSTLSPAATTTSGTPPRPFPFNTYGSGSSQEYTHHDPHRMTQSSISFPSIVELSDTSK